jgi:hypothetical protein
MRTPGVILRGAYPPGELPELVGRLVARGYMRSPGDPVERAANGSLSEVTRDDNGDIFKASRYTNPEANAKSTRKGQGTWTPTRIDIGTSFGGGWGGVGADGDASALKAGGMEAFLEHSRGTQELFGEVFDGITSPGH